MIFMFSSIDSLISLIGCGNKNMEAPNMTIFGSTLLIISIVFSTSMFILSLSKNISMFFNPLTPASPHLVWLT